VTTPQFAVLACLERSPGLSNADLARANLVTPQTMNAIVQKLDDERLLVRRPDPHHGRIRTAHLTPVGRAIVARCLEYADAVEECLLSALSERERARLLEYLTRVGDALETRLSDPTEDPAS
jgi:DNA-binding MarR family transcriptional regulator